MKWETYNSKLHPPQNRVDVIFALWPKSCVDGNTRWLEKLYRYRKFWWGSFTKSWTYTDTYHKDKPSLNVKPSDGDSATMK